MFEFSTQQLVLFLAFALLIGSLLGYLAKVLCEERQENFIKRMIQYGVEGFFSNKKVTVSPASINPLVGESIPTPKDIKSALKPFEEKPLTKPKRKKS